MKRLLIRGSGPIFSVTPCFRGGERGRLHAEEFHLVEWYRVEPSPSPPSLGPVMADVEESVALACDVAASLGAGTGRPPAHWTRVGFLDLVEETTGVSLRGDEDAGRLGELCPRLGHESGARWPPAPASLPEDRSVGALHAWSWFFTLWSDGFLHPWLARRPERGVHLVDFPPSLAALAVCQPTSVGAGDPQPGLARRFESYASGIELANGYEELRDPEEQRERFEQAQALRRYLGSSPLPVDEAFLAELRSPGLPPCTGVALGMERLLVVATGTRALEHISLALGGVD